MADSKIDLKALEDLGTIGTNIAKTLDQLQKSAVQTAKTVEDGASSSLNRALSASQTLADKLSGANANTVKSLAKQKEFSKDLAKLEVQRSKLMRQANYYGALAASSTGKQAKAFKKLQADMLNAAGNMEDLADSAKEVEESFDKLNESTAFFDNMAELVGSIPGLSKVFKEFQKASNAAREAGGGKTGMVAGFKQLGGVVSKVAGATGIGLLYNGFKRTDEQITSLSRNLNISREQAQAYRNILIDSNKESLFSSVEFIDALNSVNASLGSTGAISAKSADNMALMTKRLGLSAEEAAKLYNLSAGTNQELSDQTSAITGIVLEYNALNSTAVDYKTVLKDIANASAATQLTTGKFAGGLAKAASTARRFGLTLSQVEKMGESLLNFESSIEAELEAELLTGKQLNLERARMAALTGDNATLAAELAKNFGSAEEFSKKNVIAQTALAKSMGMTRQEMAETLIRQEAMKKVSEEYGISNLQNLSTQERLTKIMAADKSLSKAEALAKLGEQHLADQQLNRDASEAMAEAASKMKDAFSGDMFNPLTQALNGLNSSLQTLSYLLVGIGGISLLKNIKQIKTLGGGLKNLTSSFKNSAGDLIKSTSSPTGYRNAAGQFAKKPTSKFAGKGLGKLGAKLGVKGVGSLAKGLIPGMGLAFALQAAMEGDWTSAGLNAGAGLASFIPGVGTAIAGGLTAIDMGRDVYKATQSEEPKMATGGIVTSPTRALIGEAGPEAVIPLNQLYAKLDELISVVKSGGHVYMDGNKVGHTLALSTYKSN